MKFGAGPGKIKGAMLGINTYGFDNIYLFLWAAWAGFLVLLMALVFFGFENGGFLHKTEEKLGIHTVEDPEHPHHLDY